MSKFTSVFASRLGAMFEFRVARGFKPETYQSQLLRFDRFCITQNHSVPELTQDLVHDWLDSPAILNNLYGNAVAIRQFGKYLVAIGEGAYILPDKFAPHKSHHIPYLFTDGELAALFAEIDKVYICGLGTSTIKVSKAGDDFYNSASTTVTVNVVVTPKSLINLMLRLQLVLIAWLRVLG